MSALRRIPLLLVLAALMGGCTELEPEDAAASRAGGAVVPFFNVPGVVAETRTDNFSSDVLAQMIDQANASIDFSVMGFSRDQIIDALERAWHRGVALRFVGDASHLEFPSRGYALMDELGIPMVVGNTYHIMHNKFFVIDGRYVITGTGQHHIDGIRAKR